jgi:predicted SnoaL-like aldol condensation-catalyzing enzyme
MKIFGRLHFCLLLCLLSSAPLVLAQSLAPPHAPLIEGLPVPVTAHPDQLALLASELPQLATNKRTVFDFWRTVILGGQVEAMDQFLRADYIEHNHLLPTTRAAFKAWLGERLEAKAVPATIPDLVTIVAEGPYVVMAFVTHYPEANGSGNTYTSTHFEMFRLQDGLIAEHWDSLLFRAGQVIPDHGANKALPVRGTSGLAQYAQIHNDDPALFMNKRLAFDLWRHIPESGREEMAELYLDPIYIQHNPNAATGREGFQVYFSMRPESEISITLDAPLVAMLAEGDLVVQVLETEREQGGVEYKVPWFDMYRIEGHRVIEHWDTASKGELPAVMQQGLVGE